jgi:hypothetical protein
VIAVIRICPLGPVPESGSPTARPLFLHLDDDLRFTQIFRQTRILSAQLLIFFL